MPVVSIPEKNMVVRFPDDMAADEIERHIYTHVYDQPVISAAEPESGMERVKRFVSDLFEDRDPGLGPLTKEDFEAFEPGTAEVGGRKSEVDGRVARAKQSLPVLKDRLNVRATSGSPVAPVAEDRDQDEIDDERDWYGMHELDADPELVDPDPDKTLKQYASYAPYLAVKALHGVTSPVLPVFSMLGADTEGALNVATEYWRKQIGDSVKIPNVGVGFDKEGSLRIEPREPIPFADMLGATAEATGVVAGPVRAAGTAGGLVAEKLTRYARPFYRSIVRGMVTGALLGEGKKDETLQNMALFGTFEPLAYGIAEVPKVIKDSTAWRKMTIKERGLALQSFDQAIKKNPDITEGEILRKWNSASWREDAVKFRARATATRAKGEQPAGTIDRAAQEAATSPSSPVPPPTEAQIKAGNYKKGHIKLHGFDISIENPKGSIRSGTDRTGKEWSVTMKDHYGYIKETKGKDKEHLDVFIGPDPESGVVFVVDQVDPQTGKFDEHKVLLGYKNTEEAKAGYLANYEEGWQGIGGIAGVRLPDFKAWTKEGDTTRPVTRIEAPEQPPVSQLSETSEQTARTTAQDLGIIYNGIQEKADGTPARYLFTDTATGGRFMTPALDKNTVAVRLAEMRIRFEPAEPEAPRVIKTIRKPRAQTKAKDAKTLISWVRVMGGIHDPTLPGETARFSMKETRVGGLTNPKTGLPFDIMADLAMQHDWLPSGSENPTNDFMALLHRDIRGIKEGTGRAKRLSAATHTKPSGAELQEELDYADNEMIEYLLEHPEEINVIEGLTNEHRKLLEEIQAERIESAVVREAEERIRGEIADKVAREEGVSPEEAHSALAELDAFFAEKAEPAEKTTRPTLDLTHPDEKKPRASTLSEEEIERRQLEDQGQQKMPAGKGKQTTFEARPAFGQKRTVGGGTGPQRDMFTEEGQVKKQDVDLFEQARIREPGAKRKPLQPWEMGKEEYAKPPKPPIRGEGAGYNEPIKPGEWWREGRVSTRPGKEIGPKQCARCGEEIKKWYTNGKVYLGRDCYFTLKGASELAEKGESVLAGKSHKKLIQQALREGKPVPAKVLKEYKGEPWADDALQEPPFGGTGKETKPPSGYADVGGYATQIHSVLKMPEIVQLAKGLLEGRYPMVRRKLRRAGAAGVFYPTGEGRIELKADIFQDPDQAAAVLSHEIGHLVDWLPEKDLKRGNILGRIASLKKYMKHTLPEKPGAPGELTEKDRRRLRYLAKKLVKAETADKWIDEVIQKELPITPQDVLAIWNAVEDARLIHQDLYKYVAGLNAPEKKSIVKEALKGQVPEQLKRFAKIVTEKTGKKIPAEITPDAIHKKYVELINAEILKRKLFHKTEVMDELKSLTREWKPFDPARDPEYTRYRYSSPELYADAFSALINAPGLLKAKAPLFYEGFFNYLERKPAVKKLYDRIQDDIKSGTVQKNRVENLRQMFRNGDDAYAESFKDDKNFADGIAREFIDVNWMILKKIKKIGERNIPAGENPRYKLEKMAYSGSEAELYMTTVFRNVLKPLEKQNLSWDDFGEYLYHRRVATERAEMANPQGWTPELSKERIAEIRKDLSPGQVKALDEAVKAFRELRSSNVIDKVEEAELYNDELMTKLKDNENYAAFDVIKYIEKKYGRGPGAKIYRQVGTLQEISNPGTATVMKDISLIKATNKQIAAKSVVKLWQKHYPDEIRPAEKRWNGKFQEIKEPGQGSKEGLIVYLENGKAKGFYVHKYIAESFERNPVESMLIARILSTTIQPFRLAFTELNYGFWMFNIHRDFFRAAQMLPKANISNFLPYYLKGIKPAFKSVYGVPDKVVAQMQKGNMLISIADVRGLRPEDQQIERLLRMYHLQPAKWNNLILKLFGRMFTFYTNIGRGFERTTKVASYKYLKEKFPDMPGEEIEHLVRVRGGSPDFLRLGRGYPIYNNLLMFSNAMKEGYRGDYEAFAESPGEFMWKKAKYCYLPKLLMYAGSIGLLGAGIKTIYDGASEYDKTNYIIIPLGITESGKSVYHRIPLDETSRFMGGLVWKMLSRDTKKMTTGLFDYMAGQAPTIHPAVDMLVASVQYASGLNPYDHFRGRYAIPEQVFEAGGERSHEAFVKWLANKAGATMVYKFKTDDVDAIKTELEEVLGYPFVSNIAGRFIKVTNQGVRETLREMKFDIRAANTREILDAKDALAKWTRGEPLDDEDIAAILAKPDIIDRNMMVNLARKYGMVYLEEFMTATSNEEKVAVLNELMKKQAGE